MKRIMTLALVAVAFVSFAFVSAVPMAALAQETPAEETPSEGDARLEAARVHWVRGNEAMQGGDLPAAETEFRAALEQMYRASTAYNLALVLVDLGRPTEALALFDGVLALPDAELPSGRTRADILSDRASADATRAVLELSIGGAAAASVRVDGEPLGQLQRGLPVIVALDPGAHWIEGDAEGMPTSRIQIEAEASTRRDVTLTFVPAETTREPIEVPSPEEVARREVSTGEVVSPPPRPVRSALVIGLVSLGVVLIVASVLTAVFLTRDDGRFREDPIANFSALVSE